MCGNGGKSQPSPEAEVTDMPFFSLSCAAHEVNGLWKRLVISQVDFVCSVLYLVFLKDGFTDGFRSILFSTICVSLHIKHKTKCT